MAILHSYPLCPQSRFARLVLAELGLEPDLVEEKPWDRRIPFLEINPAGNLPLLVDDNGKLIVRREIDDAENFRDQLFIDEGEGAAPPPMSGEMSYDSSMEGMPMGP